MLAEHRLSLLRRRTNWDVILRKIDPDEGELQTQQHQEGESEQEEEDRVGETKLDRDKQKLGKEVERQQMPNHVAERREKQQNLLKKKRNEGEEERTKDGNFMRKEEEEEEGGSKDGRLMRKEREEEGKELETKRSDLMRKKGKESGEKYQSGVKEIDTHSLYNLMASPRVSGTLILDIRPKEEFDEFHLFGAIHVDWDQYHPRYDKGLQRSNDWIIPSLESSFIRPHTLPLLGRFHQRTFSNVVVYAAEDCLNCRRLLDSFVHFLREQRLVDSKKLYVLKGGIEDFLKKKASLVIATPSSDSSSIVSISSLYPQTMTLPYTRKRFVLPSEIIPDKLYLGGKESAQSIDVLKALKISHVLNLSVAESSPLEHLVKSLNIEDQSSIKYLNIPAGDSFSFQLQTQFDDILNFIHDALGEPLKEGNQSPSSPVLSSSTSPTPSSGRVLVHCEDGISSSSSAVLLFLISWRQISLRRAFTLVKNKRPIIKPNVNFLIQLAQFEKEQLGKSTIFFPMTDPDQLSALTPFMWRDLKGRVDRKPPFRRNKTWMDQEIVCTSDYDILSLKSISSPQNAWSSPMRMANYSASSPSKLTNDSALTPVKMTNHSTPSPLRKTNNRITPPLKKTDAMI